MRTKLETFTDFANSLYPHEVDFLMAQQKFIKKDNVAILKMIDHNSKNPSNILPYPQSIDKRTYSYIKKWVNDILHKHDVDLIYDWMVTIERRVMNDSITPDDEEFLINKLPEIKPNHYYFIRFYQVIEHYHDFLMVRNRVRNLISVSEYLEKFREQYSSSIRYNNEIKSAAEMVVSPQGTSRPEFDRLEKLLKSLYYDETLNGYSRYRAVVRLTILYYTNRAFEKLLAVYDDLDRVFKGDTFYSKRILANYYANRAMMHSKLNELELAEKYGYLSIRQRNSDYLFYLINLCAVLLKSKKNREALNLMSQSIPELKRTSSFYNKIGFAAFYIKTLLANNMVEKAVSYSSTFFEGYKKEIFEHRWHLFMSAYLQALLRNEKYSRIISLSRRHKLAEKEKEFIGKAIYLPVILWYTSLAEYIEGDISVEKLKDIIVASGKSLIDNKYRKGKIIELLNVLSFNVPVVIKDIRDEMGL